MPADPKVIFFDAVGTLIYLPVSVGEHYRAVALRFGATLGAAALDHAFRTAWKAAPERVATKGPRPDDDKGWWRDLVGQVFDAVLSPAERRRFDFDAYFEAVYAHFAGPGVWATFPDVCGALDALRKAGYRLGIISNFDRRLRIVLDDLGLRRYFEHIVISSEVGADKPDRLIFEKAVEQFGVLPDGVWHVGDDPHKDWGAEAVGLRVFRLKRSQHTLYDMLPFIRKASLS